MTPLHIVKFLLLTTLPSLSFIAIADESYPTWSVKGFGSLGFTRADTDKIGFYRNRTQTQEAKKSLEIATDSRLGVQLDVDLNDNWHITTHNLSRVIMRVIFLNKISTGHIYAGIQMKILLLEPVEWDSMPFYYPIIAM